ncbi:MAG: chemotaxis protein CheX [Planctomycetes bacterium]|nr:chemotaxis protein CheX [Planctomycetota bacterium]
MKIVVATLDAAIPGALQEVFANAKINQLEIVQTSDPAATAAAVEGQCVAFVDWAFPDPAVPTAIVAAVREKSPLAPILLLAEKEKHGETFGAMKAGATALATKPLDPPELIRTVADALKNAAPAQGRPKVNAEFINPFIDACRNVFATMCGLEITRKRLFLKEDASMLGEVSGVMGLSGTASGSVVISFSKKLACFMVAKMLGEPESEELTADVKDGVGEIINMISGQAKSMLTKTRYHFNIAIPTVVSGGSGHEITHKRGTPNIVVVFEAMGEEFALQVCLVSNES